MAAATQKGNFKVGLTGGIASGKTTVANTFAGLGVPVIDTDVIAREVVQPGEPALAEIQAEFGDDVIESSGEIDRAALRKIVFADAERRRALEAILHPRIGAETRRQTEAATGPYKMIVVPLLVSSPLRHFVERVLVVDCDESIQEQRLLERDSETREQARRIIAAQASRAERLAIADDVIVNDSDLETLERAVERLHQQYLAMADN